jgi:hypothetical protein
MRIEGLLHEIAVWKDRYQALELRFDSKFEIKRYEQLIVELRSKIQYYE